MMTFTWTTCVPPRNRQPARNRSKYFCAHKAAGGSGWSVRGLEVVTDDHRASQADRGYGGQQVLVRGEMDEFGEDHREGEAEVGEGVVDAGEAGQAVRIGHGLDF